MPQVFDSQMSPEGAQRILFGEGAVSRAGAFASRAGSRALLVSDQGVRAAGHTNVCAESLRAAGLEALLYDEVPENPRREDARALGRAARAFAPQVVVAIGGGSAIDCAKGAILELTQPAGLDERHGHVELGSPTLPMIAIPTTAGTGTECQSATLLSDSQTGTKRALLAPGLLPQVALLDPLLTRSLPADVALAGGLDAIAHGIETAVTSAQTRRSAGFALAALKLLIPNVEDALDRPERAQARGAMLLGAAVSGMAIEQSMLGAAHACANPITADAGVPHGLAVGMMLPEVVEHNGASPDCRHTFATIARACSLAPPSADESEAMAALLTFLRGLAGRAVRALTSTQRALLERTDLGRMADAATEQWTGGFNPRAMSSEDYKGLYTSALSPVHGGAS